VTRRERASDHARGHPNQGIAVIGCDAPCELFMVIVADPIAFVSPLTLKGSVILNVLPTAVDAALEYQVVKTFAS